MNLARTAIIGIAMLAVAGLVLASVSITHAQNESIPSWIKTIAGAWANDTISDAEFIKAMNALIDSNILQVYEPTKYDVKRIERGGHVIYEGYGEYINAPDDKDKCFDIDGIVRTPTINLKFKLDSWSKTWIEVMGAGVLGDSDKKERHLYVQLFNSTHPVTPVERLSVEDDGLQIEDIIGGDTIRGETYELRSIYKDQCGRTETTLGY